MISIKIVKNLNLTGVQKSLINKARVKEWGKDEKKNFSKDFEPGTEWFFVKDGVNVVSLGGLRPIKIEYSGKKYNIKGICSIISLVKGKGYGKNLIGRMIAHLKKNGKSGLGFTGKGVFFRKAGLEVKKNFIKRFVYRNPKTGKEIVDDDGDGIYFNGKDNLIRKVMSGKDNVYIEVLHW
jgi:hypothetical protein